MFKRRALRGHVQVQDQDEDAKVFYPSELRSSIACPVIDRGLVVSMMLLDP